MARLSEMDLFFLSEIATQQLREHLRRTIAFSHTTNMGAKYISIGSLLMLLRQALAGLHPLTPPYVSLLNHTPLLALPYTCITCLWSSGLTSSLSYASTSHAMPGFCLSFPFLILPSATSSACCSALLPSSTIRTIGRKKQGRTMQQQQQ
jgi:hypothetical protein